MVGRKHWPNCQTESYNVSKGGDVAQLGERSARIAEVGGSNPLVSTSIIFILKACLSSLVPKSLVKNRWK